MTSEAADLPIASRDYWLKIVDFLQHNWALVESCESGVKVWFLGDTSGVFDEMIFASDEEATHALSRNSFRRYADDTQAQTLVAVPQPPFRRQPHPNGPIYSSGRFWK